MDSSLKRLNIIYWVLFSCWNVYRKICKFQDLKLLKFADYPKRNNGNVLIIKL